ncbi:MAG: ribosome small subunit-dependent GTPase A [Granulosicoccus sp.]
MTSRFSLTSLGWQPFFQQQLSLVDWELFAPARVVEQHKSEIEVLSEAGKLVLSTTPAMPPMTVGDWILLDSDGMFSRALDRKSCFRRKAAGSDVAEQMIGANVDTAFIVCSLDDDFNLNRIERYLSVVHNALAEPVVVLSKMDICSGSAALISSVQKLGPLLCVETVNNHSEASVSVLMPWCQTGETVALLGSSGAGKSTLGNTLLGSNKQATGTIRMNDAKGRHTTTRRSLLQMPGGAMILDTPGMRELQLSDCEVGVAATFSDIVQLANKCRFSDCQHGEEPDCAVRSAIGAGTLDKRRFSNYCKLSREQAFNSASFAERRASSRELGQYHKRVLRESMRIKRG